MCGIVGALSLDRDEEPARLRILVAMGLPTPMAHWMRTTERSAVNVYLDHAGRQDPDFFDRKGLGELFERHQAGADHSRPIFLALTTSLWMDQVAASVPAVAAA